MHLLGAKIKGFKSFADSFDLQFDAGVTAVIGPNGSGKSNLAEAIRWVLGEQSLKQLRGKASSDVIFSGSATRAAAHKASVELLFSNESGRFAVDSAEVAIGRRLTRDGESEYTLNADAVRLADIQHLLAQAGIGTKSYTVISQGMVDQYVTSSSSGRRELFEEATGVKALQLKMKEGQRKLEKAQQHMYELTLISQELAPRLKVLEREARRFNEKESLQSTFAVEQKRWLTYRWHELQGSLTRLTQELEAAKSQTQKAGQQREALEQVLFSAAQQGENQSLAPLRQALADAERNFALAQERRQVSEIREKELKEKIAEAGRQLEEARAALATRKAEMTQLDWLKTMRRKLREAHGVLLEVLQSKELDEEAVAELVKEIEHVLDTTGDETTLEGARSFLTKLEAPIAAVAQAETLLKEYKSQLSGLVQAPAASRMEIEGIRVKIVAIEAASEADIDFGQLHRDLDALRSEQAAGERAAGAAASEIAKTEIELNELVQTMLREKGNQFLDSVKHSPDTGESAVEEVELTRMSAKLSALDEIDPLVVKEYEETRARFETVTRELEDASHTQANISTLIADLEAQIRERFDVQLAMINLAFGEYFARLFGGGVAALQQSQEGIEITVQLPGKKTRHVQLLSGGERALTALALLFAVLKAQKPPFLVLDEVDAALDEANADRFASLLREISRESQCIVITHNRATMGYAHTLYGVTMSEPGVSKVYSLKLQEVNEEIGQSEQEVRM
ncbi:MAG: AAA family ATPase [Candidatus Andersenbacteria bacterium]|nr:AAA family ATPase [Candidatus Andersenbacteria bacterium]